MRIALTLLASSVLATGCSASTSSRNIRTAGVVALIDVTSSSPGHAVVDTELVIGGANSNTNVVLEGGDKLSASTGGQQLPMNVAGKGEYTASFPVSEGEFSVSLLRDVDAPAPDSRGTIGPPFEIAAIDHPVSRAGESLTLSWTPVDPESPVEVALEGECLIHEQRNLGGDTGQVTFAPAELRAWKNKAAQTCPVNVTVRRTRAGSTDAALDPDSHFRLHQVRTMSFNSAP